MKFKGTGGVGKQCLDFMPNNFQELSYLDPRGNMSNLIIKPPNPEGKCESLKPGDVQKDPPEMFDCGTQCFEANVEWKYMGVCCNNGSPTGFLEHMPAADRENMFEVDCSTKYQHTGPKVNICSVTNVELNKEELTYCSGENPSCGSFAMKNEGEGKGCTDVMGPNFEQN